MSTFSDNGLNVRLAALPFRATSRHALGPDRPGSLSKIVKLPFVVVGRPCKLALLIKETFWQTRNPRQPRPDSVGKPAIMVDAATGASRFRLPRPERGRIEVGVAGRLRGAPE